jgi:hypothetical protein
MAYFHELSTIFDKRLGVDPDTIKGLTHMVQKYLRNNTAQLLHDASKQDKLSLKYVRRFMIDNPTYKDEIFAHLAPSVCQSTVYGDEDAPMCIFRTHISGAERIKLRTIFEKLHQIHIQG